MKNFILIGLAMVVLIGAAYYVLQRSNGTEIVENTSTEAGDETDMPAEEMIPVEPDGGIGDGAESLDELLNQPQSTFGQSVEGTDLTAFHYGTGETEILFVGGVHGGYSWNTSLLAYELIEYLDENPRSVPDNLRVTVIPVLNPDGLESVTGKTGRFVAADVSGDTTAARFNANNVDLNRNFDCKWEATGIWQSREVSGGSAPFSEPEAAALRDYVNGRDIAAAVVWYSAAGGVYSSSCDDRISADTRALTQTYAQASGYTPYEEFDYYAITGDMVNWLAKEDIPAISVLLTNKTDIEWSKNRQGIEAVLAAYAE